MGLHKPDRGTAKTAPLRGWLLPLIILLLGMILVVGGETAREAFRFDRSGIQSAELWRLISGHLVHLGAAHFALNAAGLGLVWYLVGRAFDWQRWLIVTAVCMLTMDLGLWFLNPGLSWYVGLSGLLHGILAAGLVERLRRPTLETVILALLVLGKLGWEQFSGPLPGSEGTAGGPVVVDAHLYGALGGALAAIGLQIRTRAAAAI